MADIRINALAGTATSSASDDYLAIDGTANGTRKLSAYSPTFGGNLAASGTGTFGGNITMTPSDSRVIGGDATGRAIFSNANTSAYVIAYGASHASFPGYVISVAAAGSAQTTLSNTGLAVTGTLSSSGNLTVSGTGLSSVGGGFKVGGTATFTGAGIELQYVAGGGNYGYFRNYNRGTSAYERLYIDGSLTVLNSDSTGNVLIGTTTDSSNGKLQLATHTTSAGGIGFGTDIALYRSAPGRLAIDHLGATDAILFWANSGTVRGFGEADGSTSNFKIGSLSAGWSTIVTSGNGVTALTLDSSQRCILSGALRLNNAYTAGAVVSTGYVTIQDSTGTTYKVAVSL